MADTLQSLATAQKTMRAELDVAKAKNKELSNALVRALQRVSSLELEVATGGTEVISSLSAAVASRAGRTLSIPAGTYAIDADITDKTTQVVPQHGVVLTAAVAATLASRVSLSQGGQFQPAAGVAISLTGRLDIPANHHAFDISLGGTMQIDQTCIDRLTPYNFGAVGDGVTDDSVAVRAWLAACQWDAGDANGGILESLPPGRFLVGLVMDEDERGDFVFGRLNKTGSRLIGAGRRISSFKFNPAPDWLAAYAYPPGSLISNGGNLYKTTDGGTSAVAPATGPSGVGSGIADGTVEWDFAGADDGSQKFICLRIEEQPATEPSLYQKIAGLQIAANGDTTHRKVAIDAHDIRRMELEDIAIETWTDSSNSTGAGSIGVLIRGRDASVMEECFIDCDTPIALAPNDNENEPLDGDGLPTVYRDESGKDIDHLSLVRCVLNCDNAYNANILRTPGTVSRNIEVTGDSTLVDGGTVFVDILDSGGVPFAGAEVEAKRTSNLLYIGRGRIEGNMGTDGWGVRVEQHENSPMQDVVVDGLLIGEGYDARREAAFGGGDAGAAWAAIKTRNVRFLTIKSGTRYFGANVVLDVDSGCVVTIEPGAILVPTDLKKVYPEHASQWTFIRDYLGHPTLQGLDHWYQLSEGSGTHASFSGSFPLGRTGSADPVLQQLRPGSLRYWLGFTNVGGQRVQVGVVDAALALASHSKLFDSVWEIDSTWTPGAITQLMGMAGDAGGPSVRMNTDGTLFVLANGISGPGATTLSVLDGLRFRVSLAHNRTAGTLTALLTKENGDREAFSGTYFAAPSNLSSQGFGAIAGISSPRGWMTACGIALDTKAEQPLAALHDATGWVEL